VRGEIEATNWKPSLEREAFVLFASVILKIGLMAVVLLILLLVIGVFHDIAGFIAAVAGWTAAFMVVRRLAEGPRQKTRFRRARQNFLSQHLRSPRPTLRGYRPPRIAAARQD